MKEGDIITEGPWSGFRVISVYTRAQAIEDGTLVDVTATAREAGILFPTAVTSAVWAEFITPDTRSRQRLSHVNDCLWLSTTYRI